MPSSGLQSRAARKAAASGQRAGRASASRTCRADWICRVRGLRGRGESGSHRDFYAAADLFCLPSFAEGLPVVLMEAMAMEIPCVTTHIAGIPELIHDGVDGLLVAPSDVDALVAALARLMDDAELRERLGKSGRARVVEQYDLRRSVERLAGIFAERVKG